jgi:hypothetical protein
MHHRTVYRQQQPYCDACKHYVLKQDGKWYILLDNDDDEDVESDEGDFADVATGVGLGLLGGLIGSLLGNGSDDDDDDDDDDGGFGGGESGGGGSDSDW